MINELFAQYLTTGKITFNELPRSFGRAQTKSFLINNEHDVDYYNDLLDDLASHLEADFEDAISWGKGRIWVM